MRSSVSVLARHGAARRGIALVLAMATTVSACSSSSSSSSQSTVGKMLTALNPFDSRSGFEQGTPGHVTGFLGSVVADEPQAALVARNTLSSGGNAADAAVAAAFALTVSLPSRAGLGGGGACLAMSTKKNGPNNNVPEAVMFVPAIPPSGGGGARPAAVPMLARGMYALHARYGSQPFGSLISPAEQMARFGVPASRAFVRDLAVVAGPLAGDPYAAEIFFKGGQPVGEGGNVLQPDLGATLAQLRTGGVGELYQGALARRFADAVAVAGGGLTLEDLRGAQPSLTQALALPGRGGDGLAFLPPPADGGLAAAAAYLALQANPNDVEGANARALGVASRWRQGGADAQSLLTANVAASDLPPLPASTTLATLDKDGNAVVCAFTMNNLFGTGRIAGTTGILLAASPRWMPAALLSAAMAYNPSLRAFRAAVGGSGQAGAPLATAFGLSQTLATGGAMPVAVPEPGRANVIACSRYLPDAESSCAWATDPRGFGLAVGSH